MPGRHTRTLARRRMYRRRRQVVGGGLLLCCALMTLAGFRLAAALTTDPVATASSSAPGAATTKARAASTPAKSPPVKAPARIAPIRATGEYARAPGGNDRHGSGRLMTYRVEVETGTQQDASAFAAAVDATLADPKSWTGQGRWSLQRVATGDIGFVVRLATPATVDRVCSTVGLNTRGYVSCRAGKFVMINLDRWLKAVPDYHGDVASYRQYVINHEVGHQLGYGHQSCPGRGQLAPVMQQQTFGLNGCRPNGWPYVGGKLVSGPSTS